MVLGLGKFVEGHALVLVVVVVLDVVVVVEADELPL